MNANHAKHENPENHNEVLFRIASPFRSSYNCNASSDAMKRTLILLLACCFTLPTFAQPGTLVWSIEISPSNVNVWSPTLAADGIIYVCADHATDSRSRPLVALNPDGSRRWAVSGMGFGLSSPTVLPDGTIYATGESNLLAMETNGVVRWRFPTGAFISTPPAIGQDGVIYLGGDRLYAINPDGTKRWDYSLQTSFPSFFAPSVAPDGTIYVCGGLPYKIYALTPTGHKKWAFPLSDAWHPPAIGRDGTVFVAVNGRLVALRSESVNPNGTKIWEYEGVGLSYGSCSPTIAADGTIYVARGDYTLYAISPEGRKKWEFQMGNSLDFNSAAIGADGTIYFGSHDFFLYAISPNGGFRWAFEASGRIASQPAIGADGTIYFGASDGRLYAVRGGATAPQHPWAMSGGDLTRSGRVKCPYGRPCFDAHARQPDGSFAVTLFGEAGRRYNLETTANLNSWMPWTNAVSANGTLRLVDRTATNGPHRFYRAVAE